MQVYRTIRVVPFLLALSICLSVIAVRPVLARQTSRYDVRQTKTTPAQPQPTPAREVQATAGITLTTITDSEGLLTLSVPPAWNDVAQGQWLLQDAPIGNKLSASPSQAEFAVNWGTPGVTVYYSDSLPQAMEPEDVLGIFDFSSACQDAGNGTLSSVQRSVVFQIWQKCAGAGTAAAVLVIYPAKARTYYAVVEVYLAGIEDLRALGPMLTSLRITPTSTTAAPLADIKATPAIAAPTPTPPPTPTPEPVVATVITDRLNLRSGPSTNVPRITVVTNGMKLAVLGQLNNCAWLRVTAPDGTQGWVSGDPQYTSLSSPCTALPTAAP